MNTAIIRNAQGIGFAIPINQARNIADQLITKGKVEHPFLGIQMVKLTPQLREQINQDPNSGMQISVEEGVLIVRVVRDSPAEAAGIRIGDVVTKIGNQPVSEPIEVRKGVSKTTVGDDLSVELMRNGSLLNLTIKVGTLPDN